MTSGGHATPEEVCSMEKPETYEDPKPDEWDKEDENMDDEDEDEDEE